LNKLIVELKDTAAVIMTAGTIEPESFIFDFGQLDFSVGGNRLYNIAGDRFRQLCDKIDKVELVVPMEYSMVKLLEIDTAGLEKYGREFIDWEAALQLPDEFGKFKFGFNRLGESFDQKRVKYLFWAAPEILIKRLIDFLGLPETVPLECQSEAMGLYLALNYSTDRQGFNSAIAIDPEGASVVISHDGDFIAAKFIGSGGASLKEEVMYYIIGAASESLKPQILICGDSAQKANLGDISWAEILQLESTSIPRNDGIYYSVFGLTLVD
jgi:hypothetical protein